MARKAVALSALGIKVNARSLEAVEGLGSCHSEADGDLQRIALHHTGNYIEELEVAALVVESTRSHCNAETIEAALGEHTLPSVALWRMAH